MSITPRDSPRERTEWKDLPAASVRDKPERSLLIPEHEQDEVLEALRCVTPRQVSSIEEAASSLHSDPVHCSLAH
ncbi:hypothetical protein AAFF_G00436060 [Aldrovandia affinis]|uniref:Uncharacterized protein n=1 Tax=Aldrovandia affinis TaxID=143900 RepID=A0AAD7S7W3_9TELE|nr:hypothetical protein AAFF_G00436060 [Aldrovandia affinis]